MFRPRQPVKWVINTGGQDHRWLGNGYSAAQGAEIIAHTDARADMLARGGDHLVICTDEKSLQLIGHSREPLPMASHNPTKQDYEYVRNGTTNLFAAVEPKAGQ